MFHINDKVTFNDKDNSNNKSIGQIMRVLRNNNVIVKKIISKNDYLFTKINTSSIISNHSKKNDTNEKIYLTQYKDDISAEKDEYENNYYIYHEQINNILSNNKYKQLFDNINEPNLLQDTIIPLFMFTILINFIILIIYLTYASLNLY